MLLINAREGDSLKITAINEGEPKKRLLDFGFCRGTHLRVCSIAPFRKTMLVSLRNFTLALRDNALSLIEVERLQ